MKRAMLIRAAALTVLGFAAMGCTGDSDPSGPGGGNGGSSAGGSGAGGASNGGTTSTPTGSGGSTTVSTAASGCPTVNGTYTETTAFATAGKTDPYALNAYSAFAPPSTLVSLTQTATGPAGLDCSAGCAVMSLSYEAGIAQWNGGAQIVEYFGATSTDVSNLLNETVTMKIAVAATPAAGATAAVPVTVAMFGQDTFASTSGVDNMWVYDLGTLTALDAASGWHTVKYKVVDAHVPSWQATRWVCASSLHTLGVVIQNKEAITATNAGTIKLYVGSVTVAP
jgi:hypothetical protein